MNFWAMYNRFADEMEYTKVAIMFDEPKWMDREGNILDQEELAFLCKVAQNFFAARYDSCDE